MNAHIQNNQIGAANAPFYLPQRDDRSRRAAI